MTTRGANDVLTTEREFKSFKGFDVIVTTCEPFKDKRDPIRGKLVGRDVHETKINVKGRIVRIPNFLVAEVRLPEAKIEQEDRK